MPGTGAQRSEVSGQKSEVSEYVRLPTANCYCQLPSKALSAYRTHLTKTETFASWTLEEFVNVLQANSKATWISSFNDRYLAFEKINKLLESDL